MKKIIIFLGILILIGGGGYLYYRYMEKLKEEKIAEEKRRKEELEREKKRKLLEEKRREFENLITLMEKYFALGKYKKVKEIAEKAFALAKKYNFSTEKIKDILHRIEVRKYLAELKRLERISRDIFTYFYVRSRLKRIPDFPELRERKKRLKNKTLRNEYLVYLYYAEKYAKKSKMGEDCRINYFLSKSYLENGIKLRKLHKILPAKEKEERILNLQNEAFFSYSKLMENTVPTNLY